MYKQIVKITNEVHSTRVKIQDIADIIRSIMAAVREDLNNAPQAVKDDLMHKHPAGKFRLNVTLEYCKLKIQMPDTLKIIDKPN